MAESGDGAGSAYEVASELDVTNPMPFYQAANDFRRLGDLDGWREAVRIAFTKPHRTRQQQFHRSFAKLALEDWSGWADYEARRYLPLEGSAQQSTFGSRCDWSHVAWDGVEDLTNRTLLIAHEQGLGDALQMLRYIPTLASRAGHLLVVTASRLVPLVQHNFGRDVEIEIDGVQRPLAFDRFVWIMSLPYLIGALPPFVPLTAPKRRRLLPSRRRALRGGICWAGSPHYLGDADRSISASVIAPLIRRSDVEWYSLQTGPRAVDADAYPSMLRPWPPLMTFADTADLIVELDFVVTVDTAVGHLAGCLGIPTYLLLSAVADPRWGLGECTPWYPTIRLVRQHRQGTWDGVVAEVNDLLVPCDDEEPRARGAPGAVIAMSTDDTAREERCDVLA
jgi:hypothetical protein